VHSEAAFAMLAGVAPIPANSGQVTTRYRLNRYGDRHLNTALHTVVQIQIQYQPATRDYVARRTAEGKTGREIKRCLSRYVARDLYRLPVEVALDRRRASEHPLVYRIPRGLLLCEATAVATAPLRASATTPGEATH
jgi:hypothetical protein